MIGYKKYQLNNGLRVILHEDHSTPMVAVNIVYDVGSKDEHPDMTGFAHLFEHLMFGGSENVPDFDTPIQMAGGENNAFTNSDMTNFYNVLPAENLETALWLESDRMRKLTFSNKALDIQKKVVVEEFKETCLNEPYGDMWHHLSAMVYKKHPYRWPTIGSVPEHIAEARLQDVVDFFYKHYNPSNAILIVAGKIDPNSTIDLIKRWFDDIPAGIKYERCLELDIEHVEYQEKMIRAQVPVPAVYFAFNMVERTHPDYYAYDLLSDAMSNGRSSRFYQKLFKQERLFSHIDAYISGTFDPGMFIIEGRLMQGVDFETAIDAVWCELDILKNAEIDTDELQKIQNKVESSLYYAEVNILHKAISLAYFELLGDVDLINHEAEKYQAVKADDIQRVAQSLFVKEKCSLLKYDIMDQPRLEAIS